MTYINVTRDLSDASHGPGGEEIYERVDNWRTAPDKVRQRDLRDYADDEDFAALAEQAHGDGGAW